MDVHTQDVAGGDAPPGQPRRIARPRLTRMLDDAAARAVVLCAPAGYGKTVLAAEWLTGRRSAWCAASAVTDAAGLAAQVARGMSELVPGGDSEAWPDDAWLVVEDYHLAAESREVDAFVERLLALTPVRLLVATRRRPAWATTRRVVHGELVLLGPDELALTHDEAAAVLDGLSAPGWLVERAEGWPALVGLAALASGGALPADRVASTLVQYVDEEVFRREPTDVQELMLAAAVPSWFDARVARDVLGVVDGERTLARLDDEGLLATSPAGGRRFHPFVRDFLLRTLAEREPRRLAGLRQRALADALADDRVEDAFELAVAAGRLETAADIAADATGSLLEAGRVETLERWLAAVGTGADRPELRLVRAELQLRRGELFAAAEGAERLARELDAAGSASSAAWRLAGRARQLLSDDRRALGWLVRAVETASTHADRIVALRNAISLAAQTEDPRLEDLVGQMAEAAGDDIDARLQLLPSRLFLASRRASLAPLWQEAESLLDRVEESPIPATRASFLRAASYLAVSRADYVRGAELAARALHVCDEFELGLPRRAFCLSSVAAADIGLRRTARVEAALDALAALPIEHTQVLVGERRNLRAKLLLTRGCADDVLREPAAEDGEPAAEAHALLALAAAAAGDVERARAEAEAAIGDARLIEACTYSRFALLLSNLVEHGATPEVEADALALLRATVDAEMLDACVLAYRAFPPLLGVLGARPEGLALVQGLAVRAHDLHLARRAGITGAEREPAGLDVLTPREKEVLALMAEGLGNRAIARRLFITEKTAKVHIGHIFDKLGVESRVQAVLVAQQLATVIS